MISFSNGSIHNNFVFNFLSKSKINKKKSTENFVWDPVSLDLEQVEKTSWIYAPFALIKDGDVFRALHPRRKKRLDCLRTWFVPHPLESTLAQIIGVSFIKAASFFIA